MLPLVIEKLKKFRFTVPSLVLLVLASYRTFTSGDSIQLVGVCAAIVPFICQFKNFPTNKDVPAIKDVISSYILNLILMVLYLGWVLLLTWAGQTFNPNYISNPHFTEMLFISIAAAKDLPPGAAHTSMTVSPCPGDAASAATFAAAS